MPRKLRNWLRAYTEYTSLLEAPEMLHFWTGVSTIAGALRRRVWLPQGRFEWAPNFYVILVGPPGIISKSTTINVGISLLREVEGVHFGPDSATWQAMGRALESAQEQVMSIPGDFNSELESMACITCAPGELGTFLDFQDRKMIDVLTSLWDSQRTTFEHATSTQGKIEIQNPWINIISATTPAWLKKNVPEEAIGGGFASRVVFVYADKKRHLIAYPGLAEDSGRQARLRADLIHDLQEIASLVGPFVLTPEAVEWGTAWYTDFHNNRPVHMASERFGGYCARKQSHMHKLAMVISAAKRSDLVIEREDLQQAEAIMTQMETSMIRVFESIGVAPTARLVDEILTFVHTYQQQKVPVTQQMLWRHCMAIMSAQDFSDAVQAGVNAGYLEIRTVGSNAVYTVKELPRAKETGG